MERIYAPGELEFLRQEEYRALGIPLNGVTLADLGKAAAGVGITVAGYGWLVG